MQKLIAKYGLAAHLALLAVAPLFLFPFCGVERIATVQLWLALYAAIWMLLSPSVRPGELPHNARYRVVSNTCRDPLFWAMLAAVIFAGVRALNGGIGLTYDAEVMTWKIADAELAFWPGSAGSAGYPLFATVITLWVLVVAVRQALGRSARYALLLVSSVLAGAAAIQALLAYFYGAKSAVAAVRCDPILMSYVGTAFAIQLLGALVALIAAFERKWNLTMPLFALAIGGTAAGMFAFAPVRVFAIFLVAALLLLLYTFVYAHQVLRNAGEFRYLVVVGLTLTIGGLIAYAILPPDEVSVRLQALVDRSFFGEGFLRLRSALSRIAHEAWMGSPWFGTGIGSFALDIRFHAVAADWPVIAHGTNAVPNGFWQLLAERGIVGTIFFGLPLGFLVFTYVRRASGGLFVWRWPHPACWVGPVTLVATLVAALFDISLLRSDVVIALGATMAVAAGSFSRAERDGHGG